MPFQAIARTALLQLPELLQAEENLQLRRLLSDLIGNFTLNCRLDDSILKYVDLVIEYSWELIHALHWKDVNMNHRDVYSICSLIIESLSISSRGVEECLRSSNVDIIKRLDLAILLGTGRYNTELEKLISLISKPWNNISAQNDDTLRAAGPLRKQPIPPCPGKIDELVSHVDVEEEAPSLLDFYERHFLSKTPVKLKGCLDQWPAYSSPDRCWSNLTNIKSAAGNRTVPIETGSSYLSQDAAQKLMSLGAFIDEYILQIAAQPSDDIHTNPDSLHGMRSSRSKMGYLAQHQLFDQIPSLRQDIITPDYCALLTPEDEETLQHLDLMKKRTAEDVSNADSEAADAMSAQSQSAVKRRRSSSISGDVDDWRTSGGEYRSIEDSGNHKNKRDVNLDASSSSDADDVIINTWFGPVGTVSPLHHDPYHNLLAQVHGFKYVRLYDPAYSNVLCPMSGKMYNNSQIDAMRADGDVENFPCIAEAKYSETVLSSGEMLFIPRWWWHLVVSIDEEAAELWLRQNQSPKCAAQEAGVAKVTVKHDHAERSDGKTITMHSHTLKLPALLVDDFAMLIRQEYIEALYRTLGGE